MRRLLCPALLAGLSIAAADNVVVDGNWQVHNSISGNESDMLCTFTQKEGELTGTCNGTQGEIRITGKVEGKNVTWVYKSQYNGGPITLTYKGASEAADKMSGSLTVEEFGVGGSFTAAKAK